MISNYNRAPKDLATDVKKMGLDVLNSSSRIMALFDNCTMIRYLKLWTFPRSRACEFVAVVEIKDDATRPLSSVDGFISSPPVPETCHRDTKT